MTWFHFIPKAQDKERLQWVQGMSALRRGDLKSADAAFANPPPKSNDLLCGQAQLCLLQKRPDDARTLLTGAHSLEPPNAGVLVMVGDLEESTGHDDQEIALYRQALELDVACDAVWYGIGLAYDHQNNRESALADYVQAVQANPSNPLARLNLAADEADLGQQSKAVADLKEYEERFPTASHIYAVETALSQLAPK